MWVLITTRWQKPHVLFVRSGADLTFGSADLNEVYNILVLKQLQDLDLPQSCDWKLTKKKIFFFFLNVLTLITVIALTALTKVLIINKRQHLELNSA